MLSGVGCGSTAVVKNADGHVGYKRLSRLARAVGVLAISATSAPSALISQLLVWFYKCKAQLAVATRGRQNCVCS